ncbi:MAG: hypothetical protein ACOCSQ_02570 [Planctomycetota bacterium]
MLCWNCGKDVSDDADFCPDCEADMSEQPTEEEMEMAEQLFGQFSEDEKDSLVSIFEQSDTAEEAVRAIMVGDCPKCESTNTSDCESDQNLADPTLAQCLDCGYLWCTECGMPVDRDDPECGHWEVCQGCEENGEMGCMIPAYDCPKIQNWIQNQEPE